MEPPNVFLVGPRASGKTSLGRMLAGRLGRPFTDADEAVVGALGASIADFVAASGWRRFRDKETAVLRRLCRQGGQVVACGGGVVLRAANRRLLGSGIVISLRADPLVLAGRLAKDPNAAQRPSLTGRPLLDEVAEVVAAREPLYTACADLVLPAGAELAALVELAAAFVAGRERSRGRGDGKDSHPTERST
jgi:shikimate kinase